MNTVKCPKCSGKGKVVVTERQWGYVPTKVVCVQCKGSGRKQ